MNVIDWGVLHCSTASANGAENATIALTFHFQFQFSITALHKKDFPQEVLFYQHGFTQYRPG